MGQMTRPFYGGYEMKKARLLAPRMATREMMDGPDLERMLDSGSWVIATVPKKPTAHAISQRRYWSRRHEAGYKRLSLLLPEHVYEAFYSQCRDGETLALLLERLLNESVTDNDHHGYLVEDK